MLPVTIFTVVMIKNCQQDAKIELLPAFLALLCNLLMDLNEHARYKRGLGRPENGVRKINSHQREALSLVTLICTLNMSKYSGGGCVPLY